MIDYGFIHRYPTTNFHELNLDWILAQMIELRSDMRNFVNQNTIKYADPIQWNITTQYEGNTVVIEPLSGNAYISSQPVPSGVPISNTDYWSVIGNFSVLYESIKASIAAADDGSNINATEARAEGSLLWLNSKLYKVLSDISIGALYITSGTGQNLEEVTIEELLNRETEERIEADENLGNVLMSSIMAVQGNIPKDVNLIKPETFGAVGDGITDDSVAIQDCVNFAHTNGKIVYFTKTYKINNQIQLYDNMHLTGIGTLICTYESSEDDARNAGNISCSNCDNITIENLNFKGTGASTSTYTNAQMIGGENGNNILINNCTFEDVQQEAAIMFFSSAYITVENCIVKNYTFTGVGFINDSHDCTIKDSKVLYGTITRSGSTHIDRYAVMLCGWDVAIAPGGMPKNNSALNNYIEDLTGEWEGIDAHGGTNFKIIGNTIVNCAIPIATFSDNSRSFLFSNSEIADNVCIQKQSNMNTNKVFYCSSFTGEYLNIHGNMFYMEWSTNPTDDRLSAYSGVVTGGRIDFHDNIIINAPNGSIVLANYAGACFIHNNVVWSTFTLTATPHMIAIADANKIISATVKNNICQGVKPYKEYNANASSLIKFIDNVYGTMNDVEWSGTRFIPDICGASELPNIYLNGHKIMNKAPASGSPAGWIGTASAWLKMANLSL